MTGSSARVGNVFFLFSATVPGRGGKNPVLKETEIFQPNANYRKFVEKNASGKMTKFLPPHEELDEKSVNLLVYSREKYSSQPAAILTVFMCVLGPSG